MGSTISLWLQYIRGISYRGPTERKKERKKEVQQEPEGTILWLYLSMNSRQSSPSDTAEIFR
jgi:hypothetical protein